MAYAEQIQIRQPEDFTDGHWQMPELFLSGNHSQWLMAQEQWRSFLDQNSGSGFAPARAHSAILHAENLGQLQNGSQPETQEKLLRDLLTDTVELTAWGTLFTHYYGERANYGSRSRYSMLYDVVAQRRRVKADIQLFDRYFRNDPIPLIYEALLAIFHDAQAIVSGQGQLSEVANIYSRRLLTGLLAEHKVVKGLRSVWPAARHATVAEERRQIDAVVPVNDKAGTKIRLQVKSRYVPNSTMQVIPHHGFLEAKVPMNPANNNPLRLSPKQKAILTQAVRQQLV